MPSFNIGGDFTWTGNTSLTGSVLNVDGTSIVLGFSTLPNIAFHATDVQIEAAGIARFDSAFGATGDVEIANSNATHLELGNTSCAIDIESTSFTQAGSGAFVINSDSVRLQTAGTDVFSSDNAQNTVITGSGLSLSSTAGGIGITATGGFLQLQGNIGSSFTDAANLSFDAPDCNFMRNTALTATIGNTSLATIWNASNINFTASMNATFICQTNFLIRAIDDNLTLQGGSSIKLIIPTLPGGNNTPLLIDTDGTIHI